VVGIYAIKVLVEDKLAKNAYEKGIQLMAHFNNMKKDFPDKIKEVRGKGLLTAFEMHNSPHLDGHNVSIELLKDGVYAKETHRSTVRIAPALTIEKWQIDKLAESIYNVIKKM
jgi:ornithine--oxo-acid transaminase